MTVIVPTYSGFCPGVKIAEKQIFKKIEKSQKTHLYILGELIHNQNYIDFLEQKHIKTVHDIKEIPPQAHVIVRTHGIDRKVEKKLRNQFKVSDLTCYKVKELQNTIFDYGEQGFFVIISGKKKHPEVIGLVSYTRDSYVIESIEELKDLLRNPITNIPRLKEYKKILITSQTTADRKLFEEICRQINIALNKDFQIEILDSICSITSMREKKALKIQKEVDFTFVVGDPKSSNAGKLYRILKSKRSFYFFRGRS